MNRSEQLVNDLQASLEKMGVKAKHLEAEEIFRLQMAAENYKAGNIPELIPDWGKDWRDRQLNEAAAEGVKKVKPSAYRFGRKKKRKS